MVDIVSPTVRSRMMSGIQGKNSLPELVVRQLLFAAGYRYRLHRRDLPGNPDIVMPSRKVAIFVNGCFWHAHQGCKYAKIPATRTEFWTAKLQANVDRDRRVHDQLISKGWRVLCVWECVTRDPQGLKVLGDLLVGWVGSESKFGEIGRLSEAQVT